MLTPVRCFPVIDHMVCSQRLQLVRLFLATSGGNHRSTSGEGELRSVMIVSLTVRYVLLFLIEDSSKQGGWATLRPRTYL